MAITKQKSRQTGIYRGSAAIKYSLIVPSIFFSST